ncbi:40S ribosomal protein S3 [Trichinella britovi]|uniref:40S ribosomal protein S3 n=1 Tax=Trichinella britovi TaxID=45882 RepID=A0A0V1DGD4_TRIBR|nr:40S ribosomal protein S3 [Trichinella britovi]
MARSEIFHQAHTIRITEITTAETFGLRSKQVSKSRTKHLQRNSTPLADISRYTVVNKWTPTCLYTQTIEGYLNIVLLVRDLYIQAFCESFDCLEIMPFASIKKKFIADGVFKAELNNFFMRELAEDGYSGVEVRKTPRKTEIIIMATRTQNVLGEKGRRIRELTSLVQKRFNLPEESVDLYAEKVAQRGLCAIAQCESLRFKLIGGLPVRRACYGILRYIMESQAKGCEVIVSGKLRGQRAKSMKFVDGLMIHSGDPTNEYVEKGVRHVVLRQGVIGIKVKIMLPHDPKGVYGPKKPLPDSVVVFEPKEEIQIKEKPSEMQYGSLTGPTPDTMGF